MDSLITIPNQKLLTVLGGDTTLLDAFRSANQVLQGAVQGIAELITRPGLINVDFADVKAVMSETGMAMMGSGSATGENRARAAAEAAISSPLLEEASIEGAKGVLVNITGGPDLSLFEVDEAMQIIHSAADPEANIIFGTVTDEKMNEEMKITVIAVRQINGEIYARVRADSPPRARLHIELCFPAQKRPESVGRSLRRGAGVPGARIE